MSINKYLTAPGSNVSVGDGAGVVNIAEGMTRGDVNDALRAIASDLAKYYKDQGSLFTTGTGAVYAVSTNSDFASYANGMTLLIRFHADCSAGATLNVNALGAKLLKMRQGSALVNVEAGAIRVGEIRQVTYDGSSFIVVGLFDYTKIKADIATLFATFDGDALLFNNVTASNNIYAGGDLSAGDVISCPYGVYTTNASMVNGNISATLAVGVAGGANLAGTTLNATFANIGGNLDVANQITTKYFLMDDSGGYFSLYNNAGVWGTIDVVGAIVKGGLSYWHPSNDGAGSGLDADLLDGQQGSYYTAITARLGYTPVQNGGGYAQWGNLVKIGWDGGSAIRVTVDSTDFNYLARSLIRADVMGEISAQNTGAIGTYGLFRVVPNGNYAPGATIAGSSLRYTNVEGTDSGIGASGTWRCMGFVSSTNPATNSTLWMRIS